MQLLLVCLSSLAKKFHQKALQVIFWNECNGKYFRSDCLRKYCENFHLFRYTIQEDMRIYLAQLFLDKPDEVLSNNSKKHPVL